MTTMQLSMLLRAEGTAAAKAAVEDVRKSTEGLRTATTSGAQADTAAAAAKRTNAQAATQLATANRQAAAATGNLFAQFQDIGVMMAAGQNPLQLAIQQGSQISQVIGPMGAAGAAKALGTAFLSMLNPINFVTIAVIAAGAAAVQWLTGASEDAETLEDHIRSVTDAVGEWRSESGKSFAELREEFGTITPGLVSMRQELQELRIREIMLDAAEATRALKAELDGGWLSSQAANIANLLGVAGTGGRGGQNPAIREIKNLMTAVAEASDVSSQLAAVQALREAFAEAVGGTQAMNLEQAAFYGQVLQTEDALRTAAVATGDVATEMAKAGEEAGVVQTLVNDIASSLGIVAGANIDGVFLRAQGPAAVLLGMVDGIIGKMASAATMRAAEAELETMSFEFSPGGQNLLNYGSRSPGGSASQLGLASRNRPARSAGRGGAGGGAARNEANALQTLITSLQGEIEALRTNDPLQREMLKHREALVGATDAERLKVEELIATREREALAIEGAKARADFFEDIGMNALDSLITKGESFNDVLKNIAQSLIQAALQAALFGSGPFGSLFGGKSIIGQLLPGLGGKAEGGMIYGAGDGTSDSILTRTSVGEFIVNARATARNRHLLEAINAGSLPGFATGGMVGGSPQSAGPNAGRTSPGIFLDLRGVKGNTEIREMVRQGVRQGLSLYDRDALPLSVRRVSSDQRRIG